MEENRKELIEWIEVIDNSEIITFLFGIMIAVKKRWGI